MQIVRTEAFAQWFDGLRDKRGRTIVAARIERIAAGNFGDCKALGGGLHELRIAFGPGYRVYFLREGDRLVILLAGGDKTSQRRDIERARAMVEEG